MKKIVLIIIAIVGIGTLFSCQKELEDPKFDPTQTVGAQITAPASGAAFVLLEENAENVMTTFTWSETQYNLNNLPATEYTIQMDVAGGGFESPSSVASTTETSYEITVGSMNSKMLAKGFAAGEAQTMEFRVRSLITDQADLTETISEIITLSITPYETVEPPPVFGPSLWIPGDYQGWAPDVAPKIFSYTDDGVFKGYMYMPEGGTYEFKFTSAPDWDHTNFGSAGDGLLDTDSEAGNLTLPGPGGYQVVVDTVNLTWTHTAESWGVIGEWLSWEDDIDLVWDAENEYLSVTLDVPEVENNRFKFRANDAWDVNLGAKDPDDGTLEQDGADISIPGEGNYTFILDFKTEEPTYQFIAN